MITTDVKALDAIADAMNALTMARTLLYGLVEAQAVEYLDDAQAHLEDAIHVLMAEVA